MNKITTVGVDLAKDVIQVCEFHNQKVRSNIKMTPLEFTQWLSSHNKAIVIFEACSTSNYWKQLATKFGHDARLISAKLVESIRQQQKTDKNDALAIVQASLLPDIKFIHGKNIDQQQLQSVLRLRELAVKQKTALNNQLRALLLEFNIHASSRNGGLNVVIQSTLEDAENGLSSYFRQALHQGWHQYSEVIKSIKVFDECLQEIVRKTPQCRKYMKLEGVGIINAINLYITFCSEETGTFRYGRDASACLGLTPIQYSSGGKTKMGTIGKCAKNSTLRSQLITGAFTYVCHAERRTPKTQKDLWIKELVARRGKKCAAVALANKTIRTAFSMMTNNTEYQAIPIAA